MNSLTKGKHKTLIWFWILAFGVASKLRIFNAVIWTHLDGKPRVSQISNHM